MHESFLSYRGARWLWIGVMLTALVIAVYGWHTTELAQPPNGGTWYGYTLGTMGAALILWLLYFGRRKRSYSSNFGGNVQGWLSAHVYLGTALLFIATLHTGLQFGLNIHTVAYALMCVVIFSGFFGVWAYFRYPDLLTANSEGRTLEEMYVDLKELDKQILRAANKLTGDMQQVIGSAIDRTSFGGGVRAQLTAADGSMVSEADGKLVSNADQNRIIDILVGRLSQTSHREESATLRQVADLFGLRRGVLQRIRKDIQIHGLLRVWLYVHIPLSFGTVAALFAHILSVFIYW